MTGAVDELEAEMLPWPAGRRDIERQNVVEIDFRNSADHDIRCHVRRQWLANPGRFALRACFAVLAEPQVPRDRGRAGQLAFDSDAPAIVGSVTSG